MRRRALAGLTATAITTAMAIGLTPAPTALTAHAAAPTTAVLSISARPRPVLGHEVMTVSGALKPVRVGRAVTLQQAVPGGWRTLGVAHTNAKGLYSLKTRAPLTGHEAIRALLVAAGGVKVVSPTLTIAPVKPVISVVSSGWVVTGGVLRTSGSFLPARPGRKVVLQRRAGNHWISLASAKLTATSHYAMSGRITLPPGSASIRVVATAFNGSPAAASATHVVIVTDAAPPLLGPFTTVYLGLTKGSTPGSYGQLAGAPALDFTDDGIVTSAVPVEGPDAGGAMLPASVRTGVYAAHDGVVDIAWDTTGTTVTLRPNPLGQLTYNSVVYGVVDPLAGVHLSGTYKRLTGGSGATIAFKADGTFVDQGITGDTDLVMTDNPSGHGAYEVRGNTVYLVYDSGPFESMALYALPQYLSSKARIMLGGTAFRKL